MHEIIHSGGLDSLVRLFTRAAKYDETDQSATSTPSETFNREQWRKHNIKQNKSNKRERDECRISK